MMLAVFQIDFTEVIWSGLVYGQEEDFYIYKDINLLETYVNSCFAYHEILLLTKME